MIELTRSPEKLYLEKQSYKKIIKLKSTASSMVTTIEKNGKLRDIKNMYIICKINE